MVDTWWNTPTIFQELNLSGFLKKIILGTFGTFKPFQPPSRFIGEYTSCAVYVPYESFYRENITLMKERPIDYFFLGEIDGVNIFLFLFFFIYFSFFIFFLFIFIYFYLFLFIFIYFYLFLFIFILYLFYIYFILFYF